MSAVAGRAQRWHVAGAVALCLALALPRLTGDLYGDERGHTRRYVEGGSWGAVFVDPALVHPPLFFVLARASVAAVGAPWAMRLPSLLAALALVPATAAAARRVLGARLAAPAAWAAATSPFALEFATEGRAYALVLLFSALALCAFHDFLERETPRRGAALAAATAGGALAHFAFLLLPAFFAVWYLGSRRRVTRAALGVAAAVAAAVGPFVALQARGGAAGVADMLQGAWSGGLAGAGNLLGRAAVALVYGYDLFLLGQLDPARTVGLAQLRANLPVAAAVAAVFAALAAALVVAMARGALRSAVAFCAAGVAVPVAIAVAGSASGWYLVREKHLAVAWVFALLLVVAGLALLWERRRWRGVVGVHAALVALAIFNGTVRADTYSRRMNWGGLAAALGARLGPGDRVVSYVSPVAHLTDRPLPLRAGDPREVVLGDAARVAGGVAGGGVAEDVAGVAGAVDAALAGAGRVFVVYEETGRHLVDPGDLLLARLRARGGCTARRYGRNLALWECAPGAEARAAGGNATPGGAGPAVGGGVPAASGAAAAGAARGGDAVR